MRTGSSPRLLSQRFFDKSEGEKAPLDPVGRFHALVRYERLRSDRSGSAFSLLVVTPLREETRQADLASLMGALDRRLRLTDEFGPWDHRSLGVLLPDTDERGARKVASDLRQLFHGRIPLACEVYVYPFERPLPGDRDFSGKGGEKAVKRGVPVDKAAAAERAIAVQPLEPLLARRLPIWKRLMDIAGAAVGLILLMPLLLATAIAVKLTSPGPVFFRQLRDGLGGERFWVLKFRTMYIDAEARKAELLAFNEQDGPAFKLTNDPRITPLGRYLRCTCIDELPQLWHVLRGQMSLVGPRPLDSREAAQCTTWQRRRNDVTPGLTCTWQLYGRTKVSFAQWMRMDLRYLRSCSFLHDLRLIFGTVGAVVMHRGSQ